MNETLTGRCSCGEISYSCVGPVMFSMICQCRQCQRITGTGHAAQFGIKAEYTTIIGNVKSYSLEADSGNEVVSAFCGTCGNPVYKTTTRMPDVYVFHAGTLDNPELFDPKMVVFSDSAQPWDFVNPDIERC